MTSNRHFRPFFCQLTDLKKKRKQQRQRRYKMVELTQFEGFSLHSKAQTSY